MKNVLYILDSFSELDGDYHCETFILREINALIRGGIDVRVLAIKGNLCSDKNSRHSFERKSGKIRTIYIKEFISLYSIFLFLFFIFCNPIVSLKLLSALFQRVFNKNLHTFFLWLKIFFAVIVISREWERKEIFCDIGHIHAHFAYVPSDIAFGLTILLPYKWSLSVHAWDVFTADKEQLVRRMETADKIFVCTKKVYDLILSLSNKIFSNPDERIIFMYHGMMPEEFDGGRNVHNRGNRCKANSEVKILSVGRLVPKKGFPILIKVCKRLREEGFSFSCNIVGDGPEKETLAEMILRYGLSDTVHLEGYIPYPKLRGYFSEADLFVLMCEEAEDGDKDGIPNVIIEAFTYGVPVIAGDAGAVREAVKNNVTGILIENPVFNVKNIVDAVKRLASDRGLRTFLVDNARRYAIENFDITENIYPLKTYFEGVTEI